MPALNIRVLQVCLDRHNCRRYATVLRSGHVDEYTLAIIKAFNEFFMQFPDVQTLDLTTFLSWYQLKYKPTPEASSIITSLLTEAFNAQCATEELSSISAELNEIELGNHLASVLLKYDSGDLESSLSQELTILLNKSRQSLKSSGNTLCTDSVRDYIMADQITGGLSWGFAPLNLYTRALRPGDSIIVAARPDKGKTTFIAHNASHWARQLKDTDKTVVWLNNEGNSIIPKSRVQQAALGCSLSAMYRIAEQNKLDECMEQLWGRADRVRVHSVHGFTYTQIMSVLDNENPAVVIWDMIDHVRGVQGTATHEKVEELYKLAREEGAIRNYTHVATSQISVEGQNLLFPQEHMLKDSKTGKQGACDLIIMIGAQDTSYIRGVSTPKNKLKLEGKPSCANITCRINPDIARFVEEEPYQAPNMGDLSSDTTSA